MKSARHFVLFVAVSLLTRAYMLPVEVIDIDEAAHAVGSWVVLDGGLLYTDFVDNKPPLLYSYYVLAQLLLGVGLIPVRWFTILLTIPLTALACSAFFNHDRRGLSAGLLFLIYSAAFLAHDMHATHAELLMILPGAWALVLIRGEEESKSMIRWLGAGLLIGIGFLLKYQVAAWLPAMGLAALYECIRRKQFVIWIPLMCAALLGLMAPLLLTYVWFRLQGGADAMLYWTIVNNLLYSANPISFHEATGRFASYALPFILVTLPLWWCAARLFQAEESAYRRILLSSLILFSILASSIGYRFFPHYFIQIYVPLSLAAAPYAVLFLFPPARMGRGLIAYSLGIWALFAAGNSILYYGNTDVYRETDPIFPRVAERIRQDSCSRSGTLFVWGYGPLYYHAKLPPATRFAVLSQSGLTGYISGNLSAQQQIQWDHWSILMTDLERKRATYIIDTSPAAIYRWDRYPIHKFPLLEKYLKDHYDQIDNVEGVLIYRRRGCQRF